MTPRTFCQAGQAEGFKSCWHGAMAMLALGSFTYNVVAFYLRRKPHLMANAAVYGGLTALEVRKVVRHLEDR